ncbi:MAG TPA: hypothetical protein VGQ36_03985 [Thermoanaerobaculia bacterium]|jgi:hypothetical protein|nr:hypothetical protein [Thermoanaerobaculia bacterium]
MRFKKVFAFILTIGAALLQAPALFAGDTIETQALVAPRLTGSWLFEVKTTASPAFRALQTFHSNGTVSESTDLIAQLGEGPGHGVWERDGDSYTATFELFIFEPDHTPAGMIRVRETMTLLSNRVLEGFAVADLILPDGTVIENIDNGPLTGRRIDVMKVKAEEIGSTPAYAPVRR